jgi:hypothetical protein
MRNKYEPKCEQYSKVKFLLPVHIHARKQFTVFLINSKYISSLLLNQKTFASSLQ